MTFLAWSMLAGLAAVAIPILIHLFKRRSARRVDWGAMEFLLGSVAHRNRLMMIEELILLAVRCLLIAAVVLAMARPLVTAGARGPWLLALLLLAAAVAAAAAATILWPRARFRVGLYTLAAALFAAGLALPALERWRLVGRWVGGGQNDVAIVLDGSGSMQLRQDGSSAFDRAVAEARAVIDALPQGNGVSLVLAGPSAEVLTPAPVSDRRSLHALLDGLAPGGGTLAVADALRAAADALAQGTRPYKKIVLLTDTQSAGWNPNGPGWQALARSLHGLAPGGKPDAGRAPVPILCRTLPPKNDFRNVAVAAIRFTRRAIGPDRPAGIEVTVRNTGLTAVDVFAVRLDVDGEEAPFALAAGPLAAGATDTVTFRCRFRAAPELGNLRGVSARVALADDLPADNVSAAVASFSARMPVLVVDGNPGRPLAERAAGFLAFALAPFGGTNSAATAAAATNATAQTPFIVPRVISAAQLGAETDFTAYRAIVLADVPRLPGAVSDRLAGYVEQGGALLVAAGGRCLPEFYNAWTGVDGDPVAGVLLTGFRAVAPGEAGAAIRAAELSQSGLAALADEKQSDLGEAAVRGYWRLSAPRAGAAARVTGLFDSGDPFLVERPLGQGRVVTIAAPLDTVAGNLPTLRAFVPLVHGLVCDLAAAPETAYLSVPAGTRPRLRLPAAAQGAAAAAAPGLRGDYYNGIEFERLVMTRTDASLDLTWPGAPAPGVAADGFSVRWTGTIRPRFTERYTFFLQGDDRARLWIDDQLLASSAALAQSGSLPLATDREHDIRIEMLESGGQASLRLEWSSTNQIREVVPAACLSIRRPASAGNADGSDALLTGADNAEYPGTLLREQGAPVVAVDHSLAPGLYRLRLPAAIAELSGPLADAHRRIPVAVTADAEEGRFVPLQPEEFETIGRAVELVRMESAGQVIAALTGEVPGRELTRHFTAAVLLLLLAEAALTRWIAGVRQTGVKAEEEPEAAA